MATERDKPGSGRYSEAWWDYVATEMEAERAETQRIWGGIDEMMLVRYEEGVSTAQERKRVEQALRDHPALREYLEIGQALDAEWQTITPPVVLGAVSIQVDAAERSTSISRPRPLKPALRWLATAAAAAAVVGIIVSSLWTWRGKSREEIAKTPPQTAPPGTGQKPPVPLPEPIDGQGKSLVAEAPTPKKSDTPKPPEQPEPPPAVVKDEEKALLLAQIAAMNEKFPSAIPLNVAGKDVRELSERIVQYQEEHPEPEIPAMVAFVARAEVTPEHEVRYAVHRAKALSGKPDSDPEVQDLWKYAASLGDDLIAGNPELKAWVLKNPPGTPEGVQKTLRVELAGLAEQSPEALKPPQGRPYLLCRVPPGLLNEAKDVHRNVRQFAIENPKLLDERLESFLMRARRPVPSDKVGIILPTYDPTKYNMGTPIGAANWNRLIAAGNPDVSIIAVVNLVINPDFLPDKGMNGVKADPTVLAYIKRAKTSAITMLACLDSTPGLKTAQSLSGEIDLWVGLYGTLDGFYLYNTPLNDMAVIYRYIRTKYGLRPIIVYETKALPQQDLLENRSADERFIVFVNNSGTPVTGFKPPDWIAKYNPNRFAGVFQGTQANLAASIDLAAAKHLGGVFISDNGLQLPVFLLDQVALIQQLNVRIMGADNAIKPAAKRNRAKVPKGR